MANILTVAKQHTIIVLTQLGRSQRQIAAQRINGNLQNQARFIALLSNSLPDKTGCEEG